MDSLAGSISSHRERWYAAGLAVSLALAALLALPVASVRLSDSSALLTVFLTLAASADALTAFLLVG